MLATSGGQILVAVAGALLVCAACAMFMGLRSLPHGRVKKCQQAIGRRPATRSPVKAAEAQRLKRRQELEGEFRARMAQLRQAGLVMCGRVIEQPTFAGMFDLTKALETCREETEYEGYEDWYEGGDSWQSSEGAAQGSYSASSKESPSRVCSPAPAPAITSPPLLSLGMNGGARGTLCMNGDAPRAPAAHGLCSPDRVRVVPAAASAAHARSF